MILLCILFEADTGT